MSTGVGQIVDDTDWTGIANKTYTKAIGRITRPTTQALADNTVVAIPFTAEDYDTDAIHSTVTNTTRITPTRAGYYRFIGSAIFSAQATPVFSDWFFRQNGTDQLPGAGRLPGQTSAFGGVAFATMDFNGTTDYMEFCMRQDSVGADDTNSTTPFIPVVEWEFVRDL